MASEGVVCIIVSELVLGVVRGLSWFKFLVFLRIDRWVEV